IRADSNSKLFSIKLEKDRTEVPNVRKDKLVLARPGACSEDICIGDKGYNLGRDNSTIEIAGFYFEKGVIKSCLHYSDDGADAWCGYGLESLAIKKFGNCADGFCVGDTVVIPKRSDHEVEILAINNKNQFT